MDFFTANINENVFRHKRVKIFKHFSVKNFTTLQNHFFSQQRLLIRSYNTVTLTIFFINANIANIKYTTQLQNILMGYCVVFCSLGRVCETLT